MREKRISDNMPIAIYNPDKKELIGIFNGAALTAKYLFPTGSTQLKQNNIISAAQRKGRVRNTVFDFDVAIRVASLDQQTELSNKKVMIKNGYPEMDFYKIKGFDSTRGSMFKEGLKKGFQ